MRQSISELRLELNIYGSHQGMTKVIGILNITEMRNNTFWIYTCSDEFNYYYGSRVHNAGENIELQQLAVIKYNLS